MYKFTEREKTLLVILAFVLLFAALYNFLVDPALRRLLVMQDEAEQLEFQRTETQQLLLRKDYLLEVYEEETALIEAAKARLYMPMTAEEVDTLITGMLLKHGLRPQTLTIDMEGYVKAIEASIDASPDGTAAEVNTFYTVTIDARGDKASFRAMLDEVSGNASMLLSGCSYVNGAGEAMIEMIIDIYVYDESRMDNQPMVIGPMVEQ